MSTHRQEARPVRSEFDLTGPLPQGTTVLEASAGTGKTYTIAALAARYVAEGTAELGQLMLVTFGRMATNELRSKVHERLVDLEARLAEAVRGETPNQPWDPLEAWLIAGGPTGLEPGELERRHLRVARSLADFDAATIATTHEFCLQMLDGLGVLGDREPQAVFVEQLRDLTREVATDLYLEHYAPTGQPPVPLDLAVELAERAVNAVHTRLVPAPDGPQDQSEAAARFRYAEAARAEVNRRKRSGRLFTYDDMLTRLRDALADPTHGPAAAQRLRDRYQVVLVDEFQDTDPIQWDIIRRAFHTTTTLILIGDPKQAIYAFRGADVASYLDAVEQADQVLTLATNWRSDHDLVVALDALMGGAALGDAEIVVRDVHAHQRQRRLTGTGAAPLRLRYLPHEIDAERLPPVGGLRPRIVADLVADVTATLAGDLLVDLGDGPRPLEPADLAVLVRKNERGEVIRDALVAAGVPAVMHGANSVFASEMATDWLTLLVALEQPRQGVVRQAALTCFFGWTFTRLAEADEDSLVALTQRVRGWSRLLAGRGVAALLEAATAQEKVTERLLGEVGGARRLTDLRHLAQSLHAAMTNGQLGVSALVEWLRERMAEARHAGLTDGTRRLETDAKAVSILTVHRSKGLEFPIVYLPEAWDRHVNHKDEGRVLTLHEPRLTSPSPGMDVASVRGECVLDVGGSGSDGRAARFAQDRAEDAGEDLRLGYVALTRAQCQVIAWWVPSHNTPASALQRFLHRSIGAVSAPAPTYPLQGDPSTARALGPQVVLEEIVPRTPSAWQPPTEAARGLDARPFARALDLDWRRTSYSGLTAAVHGVDLTPAGVGSEPEVAKEDDEAAVTAHPPTVTADAALRTVSPMAELPMGADFGTAVHAVFETVDAAAPDLAERLRSACAQELSRAPSSAITADQLATAMLPSFLTPLGPLADDRRLADVGRRNQLAELGFEFPLAGGDEPRAVVTLGLLAPLLRRHLPADDPLRDYPDLVEHPALADQPLRGYLNGSIDVVLRVADATPRYLVVDYKTNWLGSFDGESLTVGHYTPDRMAAAMMAAHYPLQALLYSVAVHRMLRWRQPGYDPAVHLGGVLYLFVRGLAGPDTPRVDGVPCGVFSWQPPAALVVDLSDLLDGMAP